MTYNTSPTTVERWKEPLDQLVASRDEVRFRTKDPHKLAYRLREALNAARLHGIEPYCNIEFTFSLEPGEVVAKPKESLIIDTKVSTGFTRFESVSSEFQVVDVMTKTKPSAAIFPDFAGDVSAVRDWAEAKGYDVVETDPLTLKAAQSGKD